MATHATHRTVAGLATGFLALSLMQTVVSPTWADTPDAPDTASTTTSTTTMTTSTPSQTTGATSGAVVLALEPWLCKFFPRFSWCNAK